MSKQPTVVFMVGLPYSGKSYYINNNKLTKGMQRTGTDMHILAIAESVNLTYNDIWQQAFKIADKAMKRDITQFIENKESFVIDQTNLTKISRKKKLDKIPPFYRKIAVVLPELTEEELKERVQKRSSHFVPYEVIENMKEKYEDVEIDEGFDAIWIDDLVEVK